MNINEERFLDNAFKKKTERLFLYSLKELRLLMERPYAYDSLVERLSTIKNKLELLHQHTLTKEEVN